MSDPKSVITEHGIIEEMIVPSAFSPVDISKDKQWNKYREYKVLGSTARICYEQTDQSLSADDSAEMAKLFDEDISEKTGRTLNLYGEAEPDDGAVYTALCQSFVFGGFLVRDGSCLDMDSSTWELRKIGTGSAAKTMLVGRLKFFSSNGSLSRREAFLIMPKPAGESGCGYIWLEGTAQEIKSHLDDFLQAVAAAKFRELIVLQK